jgi:hypothetical protein
MMMHKNKITNKSKREFFWAVTKLKTICYVFPYDLKKCLTFIVSFS